MEIKQIYKSRAEAFRLFVQSNDLPCSQSKFYQDLDRLHLVQPNKTVHLADLLAYVRTELQINPATGQSLVERDREREKQEWEIRKLKADVESRELAGRKEDNRWILKEDAFAKTAALVGLLRDSLRHHFHIGQTALVHLSAGDPSRAPELYEGLEELLAKAFNDVAGMAGVEVLFEEEDE